ncbi:hypothetical protein H6B07_12805 [Mediterraneibacter glycyrrhizinilyticus]|nr:hypothetical protein [Mediterraneibacter glycyrrhizinilyticus]MBM6803519.1 hypothetical protein [Mediterraneibacter glycyrrhizinilyticus]
MKKLRRLLLKIKADRLFTAADRLAAGIEEFPYVFKDRMLKLSLLSFFLGAIGTYAGLLIGERNFILFSWVLCGINLYQAARLYRIAKQKKYIVIEGRVSRIKGKHGIGRTCRVLIQTEDGETQELVLDKKSPLQAGKCYRFYFDENCCLTSGIRSLDAMLNVNSFYGMEEISREEG